MDQGHIIFRVLHHENISITMDAGVSLFFGLHGQYTISTAQENYTIGASEVYAVSPFTLYRTVSGEDAGVLQITLSPEILQKADWPQRQMIDCYLSRSTLTDSVAQDIRRRCATLFRLYFQQTDQVELQRQAVSLASLLWSRFSTTDSVQPDHYLECLSQQARMRHLPIAITDIRPGFVKTDLIAGSSYPLQLKPEDVAKHIVSAIENGEECTG